MRWKRILLLLEVDWRAKWYDRVYHVATGSAQNLRVLGVGPSPDFVKQFERFDGAPRPDALNNVFRPWATYLGREPQHFVPKKDRNRAGNFTVLSEVFFAVREPSNVVMGSLSSMSDRSANRNAQTRG